jgi:hypothetical protein
MQEQTAPPRDRLERRSAPVVHAPAAWRVSGWLEEVPISRTKLYAEIGAGRVRTVKVGAATLIVTSPTSYLAALQAAA